MVCFWMVLIVIMLVLMLVLVVFYLGGILNFMINLWYFLIVLVNEDVGFVG